MEGGGTGGAGTGAAGIPAPTKREILDFCDGVIARWEKDPSKDGRHVIAMVAVRAGVAWTPDETIRAIWGEIVRWAAEARGAGAAGPGAGGPAGGP